MTPANVLSRYGAVQASTSTPGQILVMLYDGLFRFLNEARAAMVEKRRGRAGESIGRAHAIIDTLCSTLDPSHAPALCENLEALYLYCMQRLITANMESRPEPIDEVLHILAPLRDAWHEVVEGPRAAASLDAR
ncbi:MAG: flagellar export chaperone FliS [Verrucomicrobia bacterium]|nr:flagellar export chaperone FliS [Verrucomicrobiota bacterium]